MQLEHEMDLVELDEGSLDSIAGGRGWGIDPNGND